MRWISSNSILPAVWWLISVVLSIILAYYFDLNSFEFFLKFKTAHPRLAGIVSGGIIVTTSIVVGSIQYVPRLLQWIRLTVLMRHFGIRNIYYSPKDDHSSINKKRKRQARLLQNTTKFVYIGVCGYEIIGGEGGSVKYGVKQGYLYNEILSNKEQITKFSIYLLNPEKRELIRKRVTDIDDTGYTVESMEREMLATLRKIKLLINEGVRIEVFFYNEYPFMRALFYDDVIFVSFYEPNFHGEETLVIEYQRNVQALFGEKNICETVCFRQYNSAFEYFTYDLPPATETQLKEKITYLEKLYP